MCLNPCCNGRCTRTWKQLKLRHQFGSLNPCCNGRCTRTQSKRAHRAHLDRVLILVVMEDALAQEVSECKVGETFSLNPCCNGRCTRTRGRVQS